MKITDEAASQLKSLSNIGCYYPIIERDVYSRLPYDDGDCFFFLRGDAVIAVNRIGLAFYWNYLRYLSAGLVSYAVDSFLYAAGLYKQKAQFGQAVVEYLGDLHWSVCLNEEARSYVFWTLNYYTETTNYSAAPVYALLHGDRPVIIAIVQEAQDKPQEEDVTFWGDWRYELDGLYVSQDYEYHIRDFRIKIQESGRFD